MHNSTVVFDATIHPKWNLTRLYNTQCFKILFKHYTTKNTCKTN